MGFFNLLKKGVWHTPVATLPLAFAGGRKVSATTGLISIDTGLNDVVFAAAVRESSATAFTGYIVRVTATDTGVIQVNARSPGTNAAATTATIRWIAFGSLY